MAQYEIWREKYPHHVIIGSEWQYYTAHSLSADVMSQLLDRDYRVSKNGKKSISTTNLEKWTKLLKNKNYSYLVFSGDKLIELVNGDNPFIDLPEIIYETQIFQTISALKDGINPETGEFFEDNSFVFSNMTKEILSLAEKYLLLTEAALSVQGMDGVSVVNDTLDSDNDDFEEEIGAFARYKQKLIDKGVVRAYEPWTEEEEKSIVCEYKQNSHVSKIAETHHRTPGAIRSRLKKLGVISEGNKTNEETLFIDTTIKEPAEITLRCEDCHTYRKGDCGGVRKASECDQYIPAVNISREERALWPTMCDASAIRTKNYEHFK